MATSLPLYMFRKGKVHDVNILDRLVPEPGAFYVMDRAYLDFSRLHLLHLHGSYFVLRSKSNTKLRRIQSRPVDRTTGLIYDQVVMPAGVTTAPRTTRSRVNSGLLFLFTC